MKGTPSAPDQEREERKEGFAALIREARASLSAILGITINMCGCQAADDLTKHRLVSLESEAKKILHILDRMDRAETSREQDPYYYKEIFSISRLCADALDAARKSAEEKGLSITMDIDSSIPPLVKGDGSRLRWILRAIFRNSVSQTHQGKISLTAVTRRFLPDGLEVLFSIIGKEYSFSFHLPFLDVTEGAPLAEKSSPKKKPLVLVAEDNPLNCKITVANLKKLGYSVITASSGQEALALFSRNVFDLVLMDIQMPGMDGIQVTKAIRALEKNGDRHTPVVAVTAYTGMKERRRCIAAGMDAFLPKPCTLEPLVSVIGNGFPSFHSSQDKTSQSSSRSRLLTFTDGNQDLARQIAEEFLRVTPTLMAEMKQAVARGDRRSLTAVAHRMKGNLAYFGAEKAEKLAETIQKSGENRCLEMLPSLLYAFFTEVNQLIAQISAEWDISPL